MLHSRRTKRNKQDVALTGRNRTGPPCSVGGPTADAPGGRCTDRARARRPADLPPAALQTPTDDYKRQTTDARDQHNTGPLGGPVINKTVSASSCKSCIHQWRRSTPVDSGIKRTVIVGIAVNFQIVVGRLTTVRLYCWHCARVFWRKWTPVLTDTQAHYHYLGNIMASQSHTPV